MNSSRIIERYSKIFKRNGIYNILLNDEIIYIGVTYSYKLKTSSMILEFEYKKKKYSISIDVSCDCNCNKKDIIILFLTIQNKHYCNKKPTQPVLAFCCNSYSMMIFNNQAKKR